MKKKLTEKERQAFIITGRAGGIANFKKVGKEGMSAAGKKGAKVRWSRDRARKRLDKRLKKLSGV